MKLKTATQIVQSYQQEEWVYFEDAIKAVEEYAKLFTSVIDKLINESKPKYSDAEKLVIKDSIDRHMYKETEMGTPIISCKKHNWTGEHYEKCPLC